MSLLRGLQRQFGTAVRAGLFVFVVVQGTVSCGVATRAISDTASSIQTSQTFIQGRRAPLTEKEQEWAKIAWTYFSNNYNHATGLVNSIDSYPSTSMWTVADFLAAVIAALEFELIDEIKFDRYVTTTLAALNNMRLYRKRIPNRFYNTANLAMIDYEGHPAQVGWSAIDIGRLLIWLRILRNRHPKYGEYIDKAIFRWNFCDVIDKCGTLYAGSESSSKVDLFQEGRLGYEEYAAAGFELVGFNTDAAAAIEPYEKVTVFDVDLLKDSRDPRNHNVFSPILSGPYLYHGLEMNWDQVDDFWSLDSVHSYKHMGDLADRVYLVQENRYFQQRILTARTDHQLAKPPYFLYDSIYADGYAWNTISDSGKPYANLAMVSTRAVFGMWALWKTSYTDRLMAITETLYDSKKGWWEGRYEVSGAYDSTLTAATNAMVLEALLYKSGGKILTEAPEPTYGEIRLVDVWRHPGRCFPPQKAVCEVQAPKSKNRLFE